MSNSIRIKRRTSGSAGAPSSLLNAELAYNEVDDTLYYGKGANADATAVTVVPIAGKGTYVDRNSDQSISGVKTFSAIPKAPTPAAGDSSTNVATTAFVATATAPQPQSPNTVYAGPASGSATALPTFRALQPADIPVLTTSKISDFASASDARIQAAAGVSIAPLDATTKTVPAMYLPSYVDDVLEYANLAAFPATGEAGKIYVANDTDLQYRWSGTAYRQLSKSPGSTDAVPEGQVNLYFTQNRVLQTVLAGFATATNVVVTASDTVLQGFQKLQAQVTARLQIANNLSDLQSAPTARTNLGLGTIAIQNANNVMITGGSIDNITLDCGVF